MPPCDKHVNPGGIQAVLLTLPMKYYSYRQRSTTAIANAVLLLFFSLLISYTIKATHLSDELLFVFNATQKAENIHVIFTWDGMVLLMRLFFSEMVGLYGDSVYICRVLARASYWQTFMGGVQVGRLAVAGVE